MNIGNKIWVIQTEYDQEGIELPKVSLKECFLVAVGDTKVIVKNTSNGEFAVDKDDCFVSAFATNEELN